MIVRYIYDRPIWKSSISGIRKRCTTNILDANNLNWFKVEVFREVKKVRSKAYSAVVNQCLDIPLGMLHHSRPGRRRQIQFSTLYFLHFQVRHPGEEYGTPFLRRWAGRVQLSLLLTTPRSLHCIRLYYLTFSVSEQGLLVFEGSLLC